MAYTDLFLESFDDETYATRFNVVTGAALAAGSMNVGKAYHHTDANNGLRLEAAPLPASFTTEFTVGMRIKQKGNGTILSGNSYTGTGNFSRHFKLVMSPDTLTLHLADSTSNQNNVATSFQTPPGWFYLEFQIKGSTSSTGAVRIYVNDVEEYSNSAVRTANSSSNDTMVMSIGAAFVYVDDLYVIDSADPSDRLGPIHIETLRPSGDGFHKEWTGGDYTDINEDPINDATFLTGSSGDRATFQFEPLQRTPTDIVAVEFLPRIGGFGDVEMLARDELGNDTVFGTQTAGGDFSTRRILMEENPITEAAWEPSEVAGYEFGVKVP